MAKTLVTACGLKLEEADGVASSTRYRWEKGVRAGSKSKKSFVESIGLELEDWEEVEQLVQSLKQKRRGSDLQVSEPPSPRYQIEPRTQDLLIESIRSNGELYDKVVLLVDKVESLVDRLEPRRPGRPRRSRA